MLLWALAPEAFSKLALAQAFTAPLLFLFISPEVVIYRDFAQWREQGSGFLAGKIRAFRLFAWGKAQLALVIAFIIPLIWQSENGYIEEFFAIIWAFSLTLAPQVSGPDREFLRLDLKLEQLNLLSFYQKGTLLGGTILVALLPESVPIPKNSVILFSLVAAFSNVSTAFLARSFALKQFIFEGVTKEGLKGLQGPAPWQTIFDSIRSFSIWSHVSGVVSNWVQTMDLFFLGLFGLAPREIGLYAAALKLANFSTALPTALANLFSLWIGRRKYDAEGKIREVRDLRRFTIGLFAANCLQAILMGVITPFIISILSHGRWSFFEQTNIFVWFLWILSGSVLLTSAFLINSWFVLRGRIKSLLFKVTLPWAFLSLIIYAVSIRIGGFYGAAVANLAISASYLLVLWGYSRIELANKDEL